MAKKKINHQDKPQDHAPPQTASAPMEDTSEKLDSLKSLNAMLLKETVERRHQVDSLLQSKGSLESDLTRSEIENEALQSELARLGDLTAQMELERSLESVFIAVQVSLQEEAVKEERDRSARSKLEIEERLRSLEGDMRGVVMEKSEMEKVRTEMESEIKLLRETLKELSVEIGTEREMSIRVSRERDAIRAELDSQIGEANNLIQTLSEAEKRERKVQAEFQKLRTEYNGAVEEKQEREKMIETILRDKDEIERSLAEANRLIGDLKREIEGMVREKQVVEEERYLEVQKKNELESAVAALNEMVLSLREEEERLLLNVADSEKRCLEGLEKRKQMGAEIDALIEENSAKESSVESLIVEKGLMIEELNELSKKLDEQKQKLDLVVTEKAEIEEVKAIKENEIVEAMKEVGRLRAATSELEETGKGQTEKIKQLESKFAQSKDALDRALAERDEALKGLDAERKKGLNLDAKLGELEKKLTEAQGGLGNIRAEKTDLIEKKKELESRCSMLSKDKASMEKSLLEAQKGLDDKQAKVELANANLGLALKMLRNTVELISESKDYGEGKVVEVGKLKGEMKLYAAELEAIRTAFKGRDTKADEMKRQVEHLQSSIAEAHKKKSFWTLVSSATTIFAAASVAYVARGR